MSLCAHQWAYGGREHITELAKMGVGCECPFWLRCSVCGSERLVRCGRTSMRACGPCGLRNKDRVHRVAASGVALGRVGLFVTLTAPSWVVHFMPNGDACRCTGGDCPDLAGWNATAGKRFNRFVQELRRDLGDSVQYFKAAETQRRGALHFHVLMRSEVGEGVLVLRKGDLRRLAIKHGFGHSVDVQAVEARHFGYVAKYASKAASNRDLVPWRGTRWIGGHRFQDELNRETGEVVRVRVGLTDRQEVESCRPTYRAWSCSRGWGRSMASVRLAQGHWAAILEFLPTWGELGFGPSAAWGRWVLCPVRPGD